MIHKALPTVPAFGIGSGLALLAQAAPALAQPERYYGPGMMWGGWFHMLFGFLMMILFLAIIVALVVLAVRWLGGSEHSPFRHAPRQGERSALDILKERLARGEIEVAEFEERRRALGE
jgi:putative membrane protein